MDLNTEMADFIRLPRRRAGTGIQIVDGYTSIFERRLQKRQKWLL